MIRRIIPKKYHYLLANLKNSLLGGYAQTHYSQFGEDIVLSKLLPSKTGFYVDVGAHHPKRYSNTYLLYKKGWRGVNIDPNPQTIELFRNSRPSDINICVGVGSKSGKMEYYMFSDPAVNTLVKHEAERWMNKDWIEFVGTKEVDIQTLSEVLGSIPYIPSIDLLSVDAEGLDLEVLQSNDWQKYRPRVVVVEDASFELENASNNALYAFMTKQGYLLKALTGSSIIFQHHYI